MPRNTHPNPARVEQGINFTPSDVGKDASISGGAIIAYTYNNDDQLRTETETAGGDTADSYHDQYQYDGARNRVHELIDTGYTAGTNGFTSENYYWYNADGQLTDEIDSAAYGTDLHQNNATVQDKYDSNGSLIETDSITYDSNHNPTVTPQVTYTYNERGQLASVTKSGTTTDHGYSASGDKVTEGGSKYLVDDNNPTGYSQVLETWNGSGSQPATTYEVGATIISRTVSGTGTGSGTQYLMPDGHGSTRQLTSGTGGQVVARDDYDGFGNSISTWTAANVANTVILYTGQMWDPGLMMYDLRARLYEPGIGRFTSYDSYNASPEDIADLHKYLYADADPIDNVDPTGHYASNAAAAIEAAIQAKYGMAYSARPNGILYGWPTGLGARPGLKPDIFDKNRLKWMEIKPLSPYGIASAAAQYLAYSSNFGPLGYSPDVSWTPQPQPMQVAGYPIYVFNIAGILFYTDLDTRDLLEIPALLLLAASLGGANNMALQLEIERMQQTVTKLAVEQLEKRAINLGEAEVGELEADVGEEALEEIV